MREVKRNMQIQSRHGSVFGLAVSVLLAACAVSCRTVSQALGPPPEELKAAQPVSAASTEEPRGVVTRALLKPGSPTLSEAKTESTSGGETAEPTAASDLSAAAEATLPAQPPSSSNAEPELADSRNTVEELLRELSEEWETLRKIFSRRSREEKIGGSLGTAARLIALSFLADGAEIDRGVLEDAVTLAADEGNALEYRLLAAAYLQRNGTQEAAARVVSALCPHAAEPALAMPAPASADFAPTDAKVFRLGNLAFAKKIQGPGQFVPADPKDVFPGNALLVYGEFENYRSLSELDPSSGQTTFRRQFEARLKLLGPEGREIDRVEFLPKERGVHTSSSPQDTINFWARYRIPAGLGPGSYRLVIEGTDLLSGATASAELRFEVGKEAGASRTP